MTELLKIVHTEDVPKCCGESIKLRNAYWATQDYLWFQCEKCGKIMQGVIK